MIGVLVIKLNSTNLSSKSYTLLSTEYTLPSDELEEIEKKYQQYDELSDIKSLLSVIIVYLKKMTMTAQVILLLRILNQTYVE